MNILDTFLFGTAILVAQILLGFGLFGVFMWMRILERDSRLPEEAGRKRDLEVTGAGRINRSGWSRRPFCRLSLYDTFLVVSVRSTRELIRYNELAAVEDVWHGKKSAVLILGRDDLDEPVTEIEFVAKEHQAILETLRANIVTS